MRRAVLATLTLLGLSSLPAAIAEQTEEESAIEAIKLCIDTHAGDVEQAVSNLRTGAEFLVEMVCADEAAHWAEVVQQLQYDEMMKQQRERCEAMDSSEPYYPMMCSGPEDMLGASGILFESTVYITTGPPEAVSYAAKTLLEHRISRLNGETTGDQ